MQAYTTDMDDWADDVRVKALTGRLAATGRNCILFINLQGIRLEG